MMAFRRAVQRLRPTFCRQIRGLPKAREQTRSSTLSPEKLSTISSTWPYRIIPAPSHIVLQNHIFCEPSRTFSTGCRSDIEDRKKSSDFASNGPLDASSSSPVEILPSEGSDISAPLLKVPASIDVAVESAYKSSPRHDLAMLFTCTVCETRSAKTMSRATYETGVVIVRCPGCNNLHLIADRYGWFGEKGGVEDFLAEKGIDVRTGSDSSYEFTVEDLAGWTSQEKPGKV
ncbi:mitochondrial protein import protein ZIM17 [Marchantia polymorpha subsp. ruderalis]|uniref:DNL-type domain-containing protein n=4 Tax=Marchantia polymorpha TaxID=3197 RepID=A0AAF6BHH5_MARPO|nr:hypothetical protein MARPO_0143s0034 [Marchantia polymorpha]BBN11459.1 hypothetical protein Mp_5g12050 [Marchantia polymorpha subsp. ruderalis]|eukprot:PTQ29359.1 hypothetical protein MARPO_0143s0034 [Marchantia polymorpha]